MNAYGYPGFPLLPQHRHAALQRRRVELAPGVHALVGYSTSNIGVIACEGGYILIDTGDDVEGVTAALKEIKALIPGALQAIILTHSHPDHRGGGTVLLEGREDVPIWAHADFGVEQRTGKGLEKISALRAGKQFGAGIPDAIYPENFMLPRFPGSTFGPLVMPNTFVHEDRQTVLLGGVTLELHRIPGESTDHLVVWLPGSGVLFSGDHVYGSFPNLAPVRGGVYRDVELWAAAVRRLMEFQPAAVMFGHNDVVRGKAIAPMLEHYAQALEYVYAETLRGLDAGKTADELATSVQLPDHLRSQPYLGEFYGALPWAVRSICAYKLGWFDGNPTHLVPLTPPEEARRMMRLAGGAEQLWDAAQKALTDEDYRWAARLADCLLCLAESRADRQQVRKLKADALEGISRGILPITGKNYLLRSALDLREEEQ